MIIDPQGFADTEVIEWADRMTGLLEFFSANVNGSDPNYERLDVAADWQQWAAGVYGGVDALGQDAPDPYAYDNWKDWAMRLFSTTNFMG